MRISGKPSVTGGLPATGSRPVSGSPSVAPAGPVQASDAVDVSGPAQFIAVAQAEIAKVPDIRTERVEALRAAIDSDVYRPDGEAVAEGLVREHSPLPQGP
jgi:flagellar biosynthesis anti-sigma factor FlgM